MSFTTGYVLYVTLLIKNSVIPVKLQIHTLNLLRAETLRPVQVNFQFRHPCADDEPFAGLSSASFNSPIFLTPGVNPVASGSMVKTVFYSHKSFFSHISFNSFRHIGVINIIKISQYNHDAGNR